MRSIEVLAAGLGIDKKLLPVCGPVIPFIEDALGMTESVLCHHFVNLAGASSDLMRIASINMPGDKVEGHLALPAIVEKLVEKLELSGECRATYFERRVQMFQGPSNGLVKPIKFFRGTCPERMAVWLISDLPVFDPSTLTVRPASIVMLNGMCAYIRKLLIRRRRNIVVDSSFIFRTVPEAINNVNA